MTEARIHDALNAIAALNGRVTPVTGPPPPDKEVSAVFRITNTEPGPGGFGAGMPATFTHTVQVALASTDHAAVVAVWRSVEFKKAVAALDARFVGMQDTYDVDGSLVVRLVTVEVSGD